MTTTIWPFFTCIPCSNSVDFTKPPSGAEIDTKFCGGTSSIPLAFMFPLRLRDSTLPSWTLIDLNCSSDKKIWFAFSCLGPLVNVPSPLLFVEDEQENSAIERQIKLIVSAFILLYVIVFSI